jgi:hypothetical protein
VGPDTYRATQKARDLELAFRDKFDHFGAGVEHLSSGKNAFQEIVERVGSLSLFSPRRFLRTRDFLEEMTPTQAKNLVPVLSKDVESSIVVTVEPSLSEATRALFSQVPKFVVYDFPLLQGTAYATWINEQAVLLGVNRLTTSQLTDLQSGDPWFVMAELQKLAVYPEQAIKKIDEAEGAFELVDRWRDQKRIQVSLAERPEFEPLIFLYLSQLRAGVRAMQGFTDGMHPYQAKKLASSPIPLLESRLARVHQAMFLSREGYGSLEETSILL